MTKVKPSRINITGTPGVGKVLAYVSENEFAWVDGGSISNDSYSVARATDETNGASRKAIYDKIESMEGGGGGGNIVFVSDPIPALGQSTIVTHNLNVTQADVEAGRYNVKITGYEGTYGISSAMMSQNYSFTKSIWSSGTASNSSVHRQTNTLKCDIYLSLTNVRVIIEDMWAVTGGGTPPVQGLTPGLYARINMYS